MKILLILIMSISLWANIGNIVAMKGSAEVERASGAVAAKMGMPLLKGDKIITVEKSRVQVMLKDSTVITIGAKSSFSFLEYNFDGTKASSVTMRANRGFFRSVTGSIGKVAPERFHVKTASATIGIRGTDFSGDIAKGREIFKCYQGAIFIDFDGKVQDLDAGMLAQIFQGKFEIKEFDASKDKVSKGKKHKKMSVRKGIIVESIDGSDVPTEVVNDVTQIVNDAANDNAANDDGNLDDPTVQPQDRPQSY